MVFNKADKPHSQTLTLAFRNRYPGSVMVSAKSGDGMNTLKERILEFVNAREKNYTVRFNAANGAYTLSSRGAAKCWKRTTRKTPWSSPSVPTSASSANYRKTKTARSKKCRCPSAIRGRLGYKRAKLACRGFAQHR